MTLTIEASQKSVQWRRADLDPLFRRLTERARQKESRTGVTPFELGDGNGLMALHAQSRAYRPRFEVVVVQPGLSAGSISQSQLDLLGSTESYIRSTINAPMKVWCSA